MSSNSFRHVSLPLDEVSGRDYAAEYANYHGKPEQRKNRSTRNKARRKLKLEKGDPREADHKKPLSRGGGNGDGNLRAVSFATNRKKGCKNEALSNDRMRELIKQYPRANVNKMVKYIDTNSRTRLNIQQVRRELADGGAWYLLTKVAVAKLDDEGVEPSGKEDISKPIVIGARDKILDGRHRVATAKARGVRELPAWVPAERFGESIYPNHRLADGAPIKTGGWLHLVPVETPLDELRADETSRADTAQSFVPSWPALRRKRDGVVMADEELEEAREPEIGDDGVYRESVGVMITLPKEIAAEWPKGREGEDDSDPHITMLFIGKVCAEGFDKVLEAVRGVCRKVSPFVLEMTDYGEFQNHEGQTIPHMIPRSLHGIELADLHERLYNAVAERGVEISHHRDSAFKSHATLAYVEPGKSYKGDKPTGTWGCGGVTIWGASDDSAFGYTFVPFTKVIEGRRARKSNKLAEHQVPLSRIS